ncbi:COX15/CtaA family protein [Alicyclobacillus tolerans]|uniref:COX15/CtaA family protein n=1 Tax=Alicyclobacillus tolerans TaxID=90970 RepID=UPI001F018BD8|nr:COX15/CtaA family protein [Alicyclobacillus tolerans]MCF8565430.1 COX15/CtaA family protein [Alicyclobacillus tolerans]
MKQTVRGRARLDYVWWLSLLTLIGLFIVNVAGFVDTETGSALGCGHQWPLCNGSVVPSSWDLQTIIEFAHRAIVGGISLLLIATAILAWRKYGHWLEVRLFILVAVGFVFVEAGLGAIGVLFSDPPAILAIHLGVSLLAFTGVALLTVVLTQIQRVAGKTAAEKTVEPHAKVAAAKPQGELHGRHLRSTHMPRHFRFWTYFALGFTFVALYVGAYIANIHAGSWFRGFPFPTESYRVAGVNLLFDILHRSIALGLVSLCIGLLISASRMRKQRKDLYRGAGLAVLFVCMQGMSGGLLVFSHLAIWAFLLHVSIVSCLFATLGYLSLQVSPEPRRRVALKGEERQGAAQAAVEEATHRPRHGQGVVQ